MKERFQEFKRNTMQNGGEPLLQKTKIEVVFDPNNLAHMEAVRVLFFPEKNSETDKRAKLELTFKFKIEPPYHDMRSMVCAKIVENVMRIHKRRMSQKPSAQVVPLQGRDRRVAMKDGK